MAARHRDRRALPSPAEGAGETRAASRQRQLSAGRSLRFGGQRSVDQRRNAVSTTHRSGEWWSVRRANRPDREMSGQHPRQPPGVRRNWSKRIQRAAVPDRLRRSARWLSPRWRRSLRSGCRVHADRSARVRRAAHARSLPSIDLPRRRPIDRSCGTATD